MCRRAKAWTARQFGLPHSRWVARMHRLMSSHRRKLNQGPYWAPLLTEYERVDWLNTVLRKLFPVYDKPICECDAEHVLHAQL